MSALITPMDEEKAVKIVQRYLAAAPMLTRQFIVHDIAQALADERTEAINVLTLVHAVHNAKIHKK